MYSGSSHIRWKIAVLGSALLLLMPIAFVHAQETGDEERLQAIEVEPPVEDQREISARTGRSEEGFGYDQPVPSGQPFSDFPLTPSEVVSPTGRATNIAAANSAVSVVDNRGIYALGKDGLGEILQGQPGLWTSGFAGNPFNTQIVIRGFQETSASKVNVLLDGTSHTISRS